MLSILSDRISRIKYVRYQISAIFSAKSNLLIFPESLFLPLPPPSSPHSSLCSILLIRLQMRRLALCILISNRQRKKWKSEKEKCCETEGSTSGKKKEERADKLWKPSGYGELD